MPTHIISVTPDSSLSEAAQIMHRHSISCLLVTKEGAPLGILTERDLARFMDRCGADGNKYLVRDVMSPNVASVVQGEDLYTAYSQMCGKNIRHLAVLDSKGRAVGVMTFTDLMRRLGMDYLSEVKTVGEVMSRELLALGPEAALRDALRAMAERGVSCVIITQGRKTLGIVTERDVTRFMTRGEGATGEDGLGAVPVKEIMSTRLHEIDPNRYAFEAVSLMEDLGVRHLVVVDRDGGLQGLITQTDIVASLIKRYAHLEFMVRKRTRQLVRKNEELEYSNQQLRHLDEIKSAFLTSVSHELRTPLTSLLGFAKVTGRVFADKFAPLVQEDRKMKRQADRISSNLDILVQEGERMARLINDFLDLTRIETGKQEWRDRLISVAEFALHAGRAVQGLFDRHEAVELVIDVPENLPLIFVDTDRLLQVMINLLNNAGKFTQKGVVRLTALNVDDEFVEVQVTDTGPGIPPKEIVKVFDKFHQLEKRDKGDTVEGTGLGLAICKEIIEHYNGRIWVESEFGRGSAFKFRIPVAKPAPGGEQDLPPLEFVPDGVDEAPLVLAVDDNPGVREYLHQLFTDEGFRIITVADGATAVRVAAEVMPQCILMDLMMPGMTGSEAIKRLRGNPVTADIPVAVLSAYPYRSKDGGDASLPKPVDEELLIQTAHGLIKGGRIKGRKCILVPKPKPEGEMLMISSGKLAYIRPDEMKTNLGNKFAGTVYVSGRQDDSRHFAKLADIDDVLVVILPEEDVE